MYTLSTSTPLRRTCVLCGRKEAAASLHLATVFDDGRTLRVCDACRDQHAWFCQNRSCRREQVGLRHSVEGLAFCGPCADAANALPSAS